MWRLLLLVCLPYLLVDASISEENNVLVLNKDNFDEFIKEREYALVMFYAPWCGHCKQMKPDFEKAAEELKEELSQSVLAKVDATVENELASAHSVSGYPTVKFYKKGKWIDYNGQRESNAIVAWFKRKMESSLRPLGSVSDVKSFLENEFIAVIGFIKDENADVRKTLEEVADSMDKYPFAVVNATDIFTEYGVEGDVQITLFKKFDEGKSIFQGEPTVKALTEFVQRESIPYVVDFSDRAAGDVFGSPVRIHFIAFVPKSDEYDKRKTELEPIAQKFKGKTHFLIIDTEVEDHQRILEFFAMAKADVPAYRMINLEKMTKYKPETTDFAPEHITKFIEDVLSGANQPFFLSQEIPPESTDPLRVIVGKNYNAVVKDKSKTVAVMLYAPTCGHCKRFAPTWDEVAQAYKNVDDVIIAKMDAVANEAEGLQVESFPTIKLYPKDSDEVIDYTGERTLDDVKKFIDFKGKVPAKEEAAEKKREEL